jgi:phage tail-like protein
MRIDEIAGLLPEIFRDALDGEGPLDALLAIMEAFHAPVEAQLGALHDTLDPRRAPAPFLRLMANWLAPGAYVETDRRDAGSAAIRPGPLRDVVAFAAEAVRLRGAPATMIEVLERATGVTGFEIVENPLGPDGAPQAFHVRVRAPASARAQLDLVRRIVAAERPAFVTFDIELLSE